jgi:hypothetical protein
MARARARIIRFKPNGILEASILFSDLRKCIKKAFAVNF